MNKEIEKKEKKVFEYYVFGSPQQKIGNLVQNKLNWWSV